MDLESDNDTDEDRESSRLELEFRPSHKLSSKFVLAKMDSLKVDVNSNKKSKDKENEADLYDLLDIGLQSGRFLFFGASYSILPSQFNPLEFTVKHHRRHKTSLRFVHIIFCLYLIIPFFCDRLYLSSCCLVNYIKKGLHVAMTFCILVSFYTIEEKGQSENPNCGFLGIFRQCTLLQKKFEAAGLHFPSKAKVKMFGWSLAIASCVVCISRQALFAGNPNNPWPWYYRHGRLLAQGITFGQWIPELNETDSNTFLALGAMGVIVDGFIANYWFYCQIIHIFFVLTVWIVFDRLNRAMKSGYFQAKDMPTVIDLHFHSTKLLNKINQFLAPMTFSLMVASIVCLCFWTNYITVDRRVNMVYAAALCFFLKTTVEIVLEADVNSKVHQITEWLESTCVYTEKFPPIDPVKLSIFTAQVYNKDCTGFRGLNFFVVTPRLALTVAGIVMTYTVAVNQFCNNSN